MMAELEEIRADALTEYEKDELSETDEFNQYSLELRELRKKIFTGEKWVPRYNCHVLFDRIQEYEFEVKEFLKRFKKMLSKTEVRIWKKKLKDTVKFAAEEGDLGFLMEYYGEECTEALSEDDENTSESIKVPERLEIHVPEKTLEESVIPKVKEIFEDAKLQENLLKNLPEVPETEFLDDESSAVDLDIEARLLRLKFFRKTWCPEPSDQTEPEKEAPPDVVNSSKPKRKSEVVEKVPTYTTKEEAEKFNYWYPQRIFTNSNISADALKNEVQATKEVGQDETPIPVLGVFMDEEVDHDHTKELPSPSSRNLFEGSTCVNTNTNTNMENLFVLLLAFIKLINFSCPKLSFVPAVFPIPVLP